MAAFSGASAEGAGAGAGSPLRASGPGQLAGSLWGGGGQAGAARSRRELSTAVPRSRSCGGTVAAPRGSPGALGVAVSAVSPSAGRAGLPPCSFSALSLHLAVLPGHLRRLRLCGSVALAVLGSQASCLLDVAVVLGNLSRPPTPAPAEEPQGVGRARLEK